MENSNDVNSTKQIERPALFNILLVICVISAIGILPLAFSDFSKDIGDWYPPYLIISFIIGLSCFIAIWNMKKAGFYAYVTFVVINQFIMLSTGIWSAGALIIPGIVIYLVYRHLDKLS